MFSHDVVVCIFAYALRNTHLHVLFNLVLTKRWSIDSMCEHTRATRTSIYSLSFEKPTVHAWLVGGS